MPRFRFLFPVPFAILAVITPVYWGGGPYDRSWDMIAWTLFVLIVAIGVLDHFQPAGSRVTPVYWLMVVIAAVILVAMPRGADRALAFIACGLTTSVLRVVSLAPPKEEDQAISLFDDDKER